MALFDFLKNLIPSRTISIKKPATPTIPSSGAAPSPQSAYFLPNNSMSTQAFALPSTSTLATPPSTAFSTPTVPQVKPKTPYGVSSSATLTPPSTPSYGYGVKAPPGMEYNGKGELTPIPSQDSSQGTTSGPTVPSVSPEALRAQELAQKAYDQSLKLSPDELSTQEDIDKLIESTKKAYLSTEGQAIPLQFITGQLASIEQRATGLAEPLERKLSRIQAARQASLEASKFALDRSDKVVESEKAAAQTAKTETESARRFGLQQDIAQKTFDQNAKEFGQTYAQNERKINLDAALRREELASKNTPTAASQTDSLNNYSLVNEILSGNTNAITGVPGISAFIPGSATQKTKNQYNQLISILSLENRSKLKGSGAISDFEARTLEKSASSLGTNLKNEDFRSELRKVKAAFATAAGLDAQVKITNPSNGQSKIGTLTRDGINSALSQGFVVEYQ